MARIKLPDSTDSLRTSYKFTLPAILQPRLTWRYTLTSLVVGYFTYCLLFWKPFFSSALPAYTGPYSVGAIDVEVPVRESRIISGAADVVFKDNGNPAFQLDTVLFTLYYPATKGVRTGKRHYWVPKPLWLTAWGYAKFAGMGNWLVGNLFTGVMGILVGGTRIPAEVDVPVVSVEEVNSSLLAAKAHKVLGYVETPTPSENGFPIIIFSHGMASSRTQYSHYLGELASRGYVCAAIEHRDGSGPGTQIIDTSKSPTKITNQLHFGLSDVKYRASSSSDPVKNRGDLDVDTFKVLQLAYREAEILETTHVIHSLNDPTKAAQVVSANSRHEGSGAGLSSSSNLWKSRLDTNLTILAGHSYGATGALQGLKPPTPFAGGIALDPGKSSGRLNANISVPLLIIHSTSWSAAHSIFYGQPHFATVREIASSLNRRKIAAWFMTSLGTSHPSVTDAPLLEPLLLKWTTGAGIDAHEGLRQYVHASDDFGRYLSTGKMQNLLAEPANSPDYKKGENGDMKEEWREYWQVHVSPVESR